MVAEPVDGGWACRWWLSLSMVAETVEATIFHLDWLNEPKISEPMPELVEGRRQNSWYKKMIFSTPYVIP